MLVRIPSLLGSDDLARIRAVLDDAPWEDGRRTAGHRAVSVKANQQVPLGAPETDKISALIAKRLAASATFVAAALPLRILPPRFNRYADDGYYGDHVDNAIFPLAGINMSVRSDVSITVFLNAPEDYDGGELVIQDTFGEHAVKLPAGDAVLYSSGALHRVTPVTRGARLASFLWAQSLVPQEHQRRLLYDLDTAIQALGTDHPDHGAVDTLTGIYHNLLREWSQT